MKALWLRHLTLAAVVGALVVAAVIVASRVKEEDRAVESYRKLRLNVEQLEARRASTEEVREVLGTPRRVQEAQRGVVWFYDIRGPGGRKELSLFVDFDRETERVIRTGYIVKN